ncbi:MAG: zinc-binding dehydrogenase, partial [Mycobacterium sp.]
MNYRAGDTAAAIREIAPDGVDIVVEVAPTPNAALDAAVVSNRATISIYANDGGGSVELDIISNMWVNVRYQFLVLYTVGDDALANARDDVAAAVRDGAMGVGEAKGLPVHYFPLEETAAAHEAVESGVTGKVLIRVAAQLSCRPAVLTEEEVAWLSHAGADLRAVFDADTTTIRERKQLLRLL